MIIWGRICRCPWGTKVLEFFTWNESWITFCLVIKHEKATDLKPGEENRQKRSRWTKYWVIGTESRSSQDADSKLDVVWWGREGGRQQDYERGAKKTRRSRCHIFHLQTFTEPRQKADKSWQKSGKKKQKLGNEFGFGRKEKGLSFTWVEPRFHKVDWCRHAVIAVSPFWWFFCDQRVDFCRNLVKCKLTFPSTCTE